MPTITYCALPEQDTAVLTVPLPLAEVALEALRALGAALQNDDPDELAVAAGVLAGALDGVVHLLPPREARA